MIFFTSCRRSLLLSKEYPARWWFAAGAAAQHKCGAPRAVRSLLLSSTPRRALSAATATSTHQAASRRTAFVALMGLACCTIDYNNNTNSGGLSIGSLSYSNCDVFTVGKITSEPTTKIKFPGMFNGMTLAGVGVRIKYVFVSVYAVGTYVESNYYESNETKQMNTTRRSKRYYQFILFLSFPEIFLQQYIFY